MADAGVTLKDLLPTPANTSPVAGTEEQLHTSMTDKPTESHALAMADHDEKGVLQQNYNGEDVANLGWNEPKSQIPSPLVGGISNEELWLLVRRFNKVSLLSGQIQIYLGYV
jgi:hypothetical protein